MRLNWLARFAATLVAVGLVPAALRAAPLNTNLVLNPSFETVDGSGNAANWLGAVDTYAYSQNYTGPALGGAGARYWFGGPGVANQVSSITANQAPIDLSANAADINAGQLGYNLSGFFSSYRDQNDFGVVTATFLASGGSTIGQATVGSQGLVSSLGFVNNGAYANARPWGTDSAIGVIPAGTQSVRISLTGTKTAGGTVVDGYVDNVDFRLTPPPTPATNDPTLWNFDNASNRLAAATGPGVMTFFDPTSSGWGAAQTQFGAASSLGLPGVPDGAGGRVDKPVMGFPKATAAQGYSVQHNNLPSGVLKANGKVGNYTMVFDVLYPQSSDGQWRSFYQTNASNTDDGELYALNAPSGGVGISGQYHGALAPGDWHRVAIVVRSTDGEGQMQKFIDGVFVGAQGTTGSAISSRWGLGPSFLLFTENNGETDAGYVSSVYFENRLWDFTEVAALGGVNAAGANLPGAAPPPVGVTTPRRIDIISHRGYGNLSNAPENTLAGHAKAWAAGARYIESDIHVTADGVAVLLHDDTVDRTTNGTGNVGGMTIAQVKTLDAGSWAGVQYTGETIPTLAEALSFSVGQGDLYLDVKVAGATMVNAIKNAIDESGVDGSKLLIWNYNNDNDTALYRAAIPNAKIIYEPNLGIINQTSAEQAAYFARLRDLGVWGFDAGTGNGQISPAFVDAAHDWGFWVATYTILSPEAMQAAILAGVDAMETDFPEYLDSIMPEYGDVNLDGVVDRADAAIVASNFGRTSGATWADGNFALPYLNDQDVDLNDLALLQAHFSASGASPAFGISAVGSVQVPEPSGAAIVIVCCLTLCATAGLPAVRKRRMVER